MPIYKFILTIRIIIRLKCITFVRGINSLSEVCMMEISGNGTVLKDMRIMEMLKLSSVPVLMVGEFHFSYRVPFFQGT